jgi:hypothetical protein
MREAHRKVWQADVGGLDRFIPRTR